MLLRLARDQHLIEVVLPIVEDLRRRGFWVSDALLDQIRREEVEI